MPRSHVKVFVRTRPTARPYEGFRVHKDGETVTVNLPKEESSGLINNQLESLTFKARSALIRLTAAFDGVLENVSQDAVYGAAGAAAVDAVLSGYNATVFCYGQTGAGKTFTMCGDGRNYTHRGVIPRALHQIFREIDMRPDKTYRVAVSYLEIHNEALYDLLAESPGTSSEALAIMDEAAAGGGCNVRGLTQEFVASEEEALAQFFAGEQARSTAPHALNALSSRSHALFSVALEMRTSEDAAERAVVCAGGVSKLTLVDLAGSERTKKTNASGAAMREAACINKSLSFLEQVVNALARRDAHVPFRQTKLTAALKDALGGNCVTVMVANLWPEAVHLEECVSTLRFASRVRSLETDASVNESADPALLLRRYERQVRELKQELAMRDMLSGRAHVSYDDLSEAEQRELRELVGRYFAGQAGLDELPTDSLKRIRETYRAMRAIATAGGGALGASPAAQLQQAEGRGGPGAGAEEAGLVGDLDPGSQRGFILGSAPLGARPPGSPAAAATATGGGGGGGWGTGRRPASGRVGGASGERPLSVGTGAGATADAAGGVGQLGGTQQLAGAVAADAPPLRLDFNALFLKWKAGSGEGRRLAAAVRERGRALAELKASVKDAAARVNAAKAAIDALVAAGLAAPGDEGAVEHLRAAKASYRAEFDRLRELRGGLAPATDALAAVKAQQLEAFEAWAAAQGLPGGAGGAAGRIQAFHGAAAAAGAGGSDEEDFEELDPAETFERLQMAKLLQTDPAGDSSAFHAARKRTVAGGGAAAARGTLKASPVPR
ncbi:kinesin [Raphidocelis subcapitata]|uniref:Kinesin-like protein n=1 Tax=Raphidocelis subcapitata TaxID=307507 RepID=A0A2V0P2T3_9CHLO|nr:kinesin [Raphidocelis subcapitata]|eukprot:GBF92163.1 kinesin [Raphidocelis subcapitata]